MTCGTGNWELLRSSSSNCCCKTIIFSLNSSPQIRERPTRQAKKTCFLLLVFQVHFNWKFLTFLCCRKYLFLSLGWRLSSWLISVNQKVPLIFLFLSLVLQSKAHMDVLAWIMHCILSVLCWNEISRTRWFDRHLTTRWAPPCLSGPSILFNKPKFSIFRPFHFLSHYDFLKWIPLR